MRTYICTKFVYAVPIAREVGTVKVDGYKVIYTDGHEDFISKAVFEEDYHPSTGMNFGLAIEAVKMGKKCRRAGWNGKNQHIELATRISYMTAGGVYMNVEHEAFGNKAIAFVGTSGVQMGWLASQADMLAEDWEIVE